MSFPEADALLGEISTRLDVTIHCGKISFLFCSETEGMQRLQMTTRNLSLPLNCSCLRFKQEQLIDGSISDDLP